MEMPTTQLAPTLTHACRVVTDGEDWWLSCSCGWVSLTYATRDAAQRSWCLVEEELAQSEQRRAMLRSMGVNV